jgi:hypothetical protein
MAAEKDAAADGAAPLNAPRGPLRPWTRLAGTRGAWAGRAGCGPAAAKEAPRGATCAHDLARRMASRALSAAPDALCARAAGAACALGALSRVSWTAASRLRDAAASPHLIRLSTTATVPPGGFATRSGPRSARGQPAWQPGRALQPVWLRRAQAAADHPASRSRGDACGALQSSPAFQRVSRALRMAEHGHVIAARRMEQVTQHARRCA